MSIASNSYVPGIFSLKIARGRVYVESLALCSSYSACVAFSWVNTLIRRHLTSSHGEIFGLGAINIG